MHGTPRQGGGIYQVQSSSPRRNQIIRILQTIRLDRLSTHDINSEDVPDVRQKSQTYLGGCMSSPRLWSPAGTRTANDTEKKDSKNISPTSPFNDRRFHSNPKLRRPRKSRRSAHGVLWNQSASSHNRDSFKRALLAPAGDSDLCSHRSAPPDHQTHRTGNIMRD